MMKRALLLGVTAVAASLAGCSTRDADLAKFIAQTKQEQPGGVEPLPEVKPYDGFFYTDQNMRSPFVPGGNGESSNSGVRPDVKRNRQFLEQFSLDTLSMVGTLRMGARQYGLVRTSDGLVHRVVPGDYLGQNDGRITAIDATRINVTEIVPDGLGGYMERTASVALNE
jgi:type IV pilus assembly protein PilP